MEIRRNLKKLEKKILYYMIDRLFSNNFWVGFIIVQIFMLLLLGFDFIDSILLAISPILLIMLCSCYFIYKLYKEANEIYEMYEYEDYF